MRTHCQTGRFTYRPHLLMADRTVEIGKHGFYLLRDGRRDYRIDYDEITALRFSELQETVAVIDRVLMFGYTVNTGIHK